LLKLAFTNLLANAVKFTRKQAVALIEVGSRVTGGVPTIFVRDNGVGFDPQYADKLFGFSSACTGRKSSKELASGWRQCSESCGGMGERSGRNRSRMRELHFFHAGATVRDAARSGDDGDKTCLRPNR
jgi:hypothetical protein